MEKSATIAQNQYRTHTCGELSIENVGETVRLSGWVDTRRDHGGLIFIDLRDKWGITQLTFNPSQNKDVWQQAEELRSEYVVSVEGIVRQRPSEMVNDKLSTGTIEIEVSKLSVLSTAQTPPFDIHQDLEVNEELRFTYRYLNLRHSRVQRMLAQRDKFIQHVRRYMQGQGFTEVQTPILTSSSPEGARDFLIPSRLYPGSFYALPQAPQQFKQLLMVGGLDRYFQIAPCFRDEDPRADRHAGEFYQLDLEMSFVEQEDVWQVVEPLMIELTEAFSDKTIIQKPFPRLTWHEAMLKYGSDKPDLRYELFISDVSDTVRDSGFSVFDKALGDGGVVHALHVPGGAQLSRKDIDDLTEHAKVHGAGGLAYIMVKDEITSPIIKYLGEEKAAAVAKAVAAQKGDAIFFGADNFTQAAKALGAVRDLAADKLNLKDPKKAAWVWITDFPMYEYNEEEDKIDFSHNPFSMPQLHKKDFLALSDEQEIVSISAYLYDVVLNGYEIATGAIRNHDPEIMYKAFAIAGYSKEEVDQKFGGMINAFKYGAPPHAGIAPGLDRLFFILLDAPNIREIYAFPKDSKAKDLMMNAPAPVSKTQLKELHIEVEDDE